LPKAATVYTFTIYVKDAPVFSFNDRQARRKMISKKRIDKLSGPPGSQTGTPYLL